MKKKKLKKMLKKTQKMVDAQRTVIADHSNAISLISERVDKLSRRLDKVENLSASSAATGEEIKDIKKQISVLRDRTNVDYSSMSKVKDMPSLARLREICASCKHADKKMSEHPCDTCCILDHWEAKDNG